MDPRKTTWERVKLGSFIRSKEGVTWKVVKANSTHWGLRNRAGETKILPKPDPSAEATIFYLTQSELETMLIEELGATLTDVKPEGSQVFISRPWGDLRLVEMKSHLKLMHALPTESVNDPGKPAGMNSKKALTECHDHQHQKPRKNWTPHIHDAEKLRQWPDDQEAK